MNRIKSDVTINKEISNYLDGKKNRENKGDIDD